MLVHIHIYVNLTFKLFAFTKHHTDISLSFPSNLTYFDCSYQNNQFAIRVNEP